MMLNITEKEIYERLGLEDPFLFTVRALERNEEMIEKGEIRAGEWQRQSGRSTLMLVQVIYDVLNQDCGRSIVTPNATTAMIIKEKLECMLRKLGVSTIISQNGLILPNEYMILIGSSRAVTGDNNIKIYFEHSFHRN